MQQYMMRRLFLMVPTMFLVTLIVFSLVRLMPGDVIVQQLVAAPEFTEEDIDLLRGKLGLNRPFHVQYGRWLWDAVRGDFGDSLVRNSSARDLILDRLPITLELALLAFVIATSFAMVLGIVSAVQQDGIIDYVLRVLSITALSVPNFWIATLVIVGGAIYFNYAPPLEYALPHEDPLKNLEQFLIPATIVGISSFGVTMRLVRSSMLEVLRQDFVRTARAKGLTETKVIYRHAVRNALLPVVTLIGFQLGALLTGTVIIEIIYGLPGLGTLTFDAILKRDYTLIQAATLMFGVVFLFVNLIIDLSYAWIDPRIKY